ncbi:WD40 repeat-like protein [Lentithecium fluviatile CBS 122367]|uniref:WD40 repeat-like protein n=1 Tax=Lentithecium fluviatile CBS 122367 TaxID=1168545 RepID=A0A6G1J075_9PLEO|nr:WD40 repeat-like protein [Lentithecium fluviatile CBS 122367]
MFRWYRNATRCYVYLSDVSSTASKGSEEESAPPWELKFRESRWFTRGWTLQELLAPSRVEFFSKERNRCGDKTSLKQHIHETTGIPVTALEGAALTQFSINERLSWNEHRQTKHEEDKAYSFLGIFGVYLSPIYGEGISGAFRRLHDEIDKLGRRIQELHLTDPRNDKKRIEDTKGGLLKDSYRWVLDNAEFQKWRDDGQSRLLWIKGDPGKGKTMLLCGIVDDLQKSKARADPLSFYFCQATDSRINNATAVLQGLLYMLVDQHPSLASHVRKKYDYVGKALFEDANAWVALAEIFTNVLQDPSSSSMYLIIDALDECVVGLLKLLDFVVEKSSASRVKWVVSSRNWPNIEERLANVGHRVRLSLKLNADSSVNSVAVSHDSTQLVSASDDRTVKLWDARSGECLSTLEGHSSSVNSVAFSHDSTQLVSASGDGTVKVWDACSGECLSMFEGHRNFVYSAAFSYDSTQLASASDDGTVKVWDARSGECLSTIKVEKPLRSISFDSSDRCLHTDIGVINISALPILTPALIGAKPQIPLELLIIN